MIPIWKLKRELKRLTDQLIGLPRTIATLPRRFREPQLRRAHDAAFPGNLRITAGDMAASDRLAVVVLFQPKGLAASTFETCENLRHGGYSPLVMSNAPLSDSDTARLAKSCWRVVSRPNFGYDFGAYRDGMRLIRQAGISPDQVILMNDSFWCDLTPALLDRVKARQADLFGLLQDEKVKHDTKGGTQTSRMHIESYFLVVSGQLWRSAVFEQFWHNYPMTDIKPKTIKHGEIGFSRAMADAGYHLAALTSRDAFLTQLARFDATELQQVLAYASYDDATFKAEAGDLLASAPDQPEWRAAVLDHIRRWVNRRRFNAAYPLASAKIFGTSFVKKSNEPIFRAARRSYVTGVNAGLIAPPSAVILSEIERAKN